MYLEHWGLFKKPFENTPDPEIFYYSEEHKECYDRMSYAVEGNKGGALLTGEYGCGKTTLLRILANNSMTEDREVVVVNNPQLESDELLREILYQLGEESEERSRAKLSRRIEEVLFGKFQAGKEVLILIDEAQLIKGENVFEELRLLLNHQLNDKFLVTILLVGQPELREKISSMPQFDQRLGIKYHLHSFNLEDTKNYIRYRLESAGGKPDIVNEDAITTIFNASFGVPRRINNICDLALMTGARRKLKTVDSALINMVI
ncbi:MAG: AAA family ATPase [Candidatus Marinimicrobia bacterium]|nr:AAA family ATPase [Candidatus Neomarinimicrobiota bacterium]TFB10267.1 AAA family ATPase [Candidatus Marinimicrobia bacterium MT.SAG.2]